MKSFVFLYTFLQFTYAFRSVFSRSKLSKVVCYESSVESTEYIAKLKQNHETVVKKLRDKVAGMSLKETFAAICGYNKETDEGLLYDGVDIIRKEPTINQFVIANPKGFLERPDLAKYYGVDFTLTSLDTDLELSELAKLLPVIYIADIHSDYGTLGLQLNNKCSTMVMNDIYPSLRSLRKRPIYQGGAAKKGSSFMMVHKKAGFPDNRSWRTLPGNNDFRLFYSPDVAMANELCMTKDASPEEFKFFQWTTVWPPNQLDREYDQKLWITISAPPKVIFDDDYPNVCPLYKRLICSLPEEYVTFSD